MGFRRLTVRECAAILALGASLAILDGAARGDPLTTGPAPSLTPDDVLHQQRHDLVNATLGLSRSTLVDLRCTTAVDGAVTTSVAIKGRDWTIDLQPYSVRTAGYKLYRSDGPDHLVEVTPGPVRTLRGALGEDDGSVVAGAMGDDGLRAVVEFADGDRYWIEPVSEIVDGLDATAHVLYHEQDTTPHGGSCASDAMQAAAGADGQGAGADAAAESAADGPPAVAELACDADYPYFVDYGSVSAVEARIELITNTVNAQYENEVGITHTITAIIVRTSPGTYSTSDANELLQDFRTEWFTNHALIQRDVAKLFTGRQLLGDTIGIAWTVGAICTPSAYCLVQSDYNSNLNCATDLSAHELGHLWGAFHCDPCSTTMRSSINCANTFNAASVASITAHRDSRTCLQPLGTYCTAAVANSGFEHITNVTFGDIDNSSGSDGYADYTSEVTDLSVGQSLPLTITLGSGASTDIGGVWIDWNDDGDFTDSGEEVTTGLSGSGPYMTTVNVPGTISSGLSRMRVRIQDGAANPVLQPCGVASFGEVEDYGLDLSDLPPPVNDNCADATPIGVETLAFSTLGASTDGPEEIIACDTDGDAHIRSDVWYELTAPCFGQYTVSLCGSSYDTRVGVYNNCPTGPAQIIACNDDFCGDQSELQFIGSPGNTYLIRIGGFEGAKGEGTMTINVQCMGEGACCLPGGTCDLLTPEDCTAAGGSHEGIGTDCNPVPCTATCPEDVDGSGDVGFADILEVITSWGPCGVPCPEDVDGSGDVGFADILEIITSWGPC